MKRSKGSGPKKWEGNKSARDKNKGPGVETAPRKGETSVEARGDLAPQNSLQEAPERPPEEPQETSQKMLLSKTYARPRAVAGLAESH